MLFLRISIYSLIILILLPLICEYSEDMTGSEAGERMGVVLGNDQEPGFEHGLKYNSVICTLSTKPSALTIVLILPLYYYT